MRFRALLLPAFLLTAASLDARALSWNRMDVVARLDADGRLHSSETLTYLFDGDWNGGERSFDIRVGQTLRLAGVSRIEGGQRHSARQRQSESVIAGISRPVSLAFAVLFISGSGPHGA